MTDREAELDEEQTTLEKKQEAVKDELRTLKQDIERKQTELNEKSSFLKVAEIIESEGDPVEIIRLQEQIVAYGKLCFKLFHSKHHIKLQLCSKTQD